MDPVAPSDAELSDLGSADAEPSRWAGLAVGVGAGLIVVQALFVLITVIQGLSLHRNGAGGFPGDIFHRIGIAFSTSVNIPSGLALTAGALLVAAPSLAGLDDERVPRWSPGLRTALLVMVDVVAIVIAVGTVLGVRASLRLDNLQTTPVTGYQRWELTAYTAGTVGTALVAFITALVAMPGRRDRDLDDEMYDAPAELLVDQLVVEELGGSVDSDA